MYALASGRTPRARTPTRRHAVRKQNYLILRPSHFKR